MTLDYMAVGLHIFLPVLLGRLFSRTLNRSSMLKKSAVPSRNSHLKIEYHHVASCNLLLCKRQSLDHFGHTESKSNEGNRITTIGPFSKSILNRSEVV